MIAADTIAALHWWETARRWVTRGNLFVVGCATVMLFAYCQGESHGIAKEKQHAASVTWKALQDSTKAIEQRMAKRAPVIVQAQARVDTIIQRYHAGTTHVLVFNDTLLKVDSVLVPVMPAIAERIATADSTITALMTLDSVHVAQLTDMTADRDTWKSRALLDEATAPKPSRFGFKSGLTVGVAIVATIVHFVR